MAADLLGRVLVALVSSQTGHAMARGSEARASPWGWVALEANSKRRRRGVMVSSSNRILKTRRRRPPPARAMSQCQTALEREERADVDVCTYRSPKCLRHCLGWDHDERMG